MNASQPRAMFRRARVAAAAIFAFLLLVTWQVSAPPPAYADGPTTFSNTTPIEIPVSTTSTQTGPASPYPSNIVVSGMTGPITGVSVTFHGVTHHALNDIDAMLVSPSGENLVILSDAFFESASASASNADLAFADLGSPLPSVGNVASGTYMPSDNSSVGSPDTFPAPAPTSPSSTTFASAFSGIGPNGIWKLYIVDDTTGDLGEMAGGWSLNITTLETAIATTTSVSSSQPSSQTGESVTFTATVSSASGPVTTGQVLFEIDGARAFTVPASGASFRVNTLQEGTRLVSAIYLGIPDLLLPSSGSVTQRVDNATVVNGQEFCNVGQITGHSSGSAVPYPSNIFVSGLSGTITNVTASIKGLSHDFLPDFDILLSGPDPDKNLFLMSDSVGGVPADGIDLVFDDSAAGTVPIPLISGTYKPSNNGAGPDSMPGPAPSGDTTLSIFNGASPNGTWSLWVVDDAPGDSGAIEDGWCLEFTTQSTSTTQLTTTPNPSSYGESVTFTATVTADGAPATAGTVTFSDGGTDLGVATLDATGQATFVTSALDVGAHTITATYSGTSEIVGSDSTVTHSISKATPAISLMSDGSPSILDDAITFTATVASSGTPVVTGPVTFEVDGIEVGSSNLNVNGEATYTLTSLGEGPHNIVAIFGGSAQYEQVRSTTFVQTVQLAAVDLPEEQVPQPSTTGAPAQPSTTGAPAQLSTTGAPAQTGLWWIGSGAIAAGLLACAGSLIWRRKRTNS